MNNFQPYKVVGRGSETTSRGKFKGIKYIREIMTKAKIASYNIINVCIFCVNEMCIQLEFHEGLLYSGAIKFLEKMNKHKVFKN